MAAILALYFACVIWDAKHDVNAAPRTDMFVCDKHGAFPSKYCLKLGDDFEQGRDATGKIIRGPLLCCPMCYEDSMKRAKEKHGV